MAPEMVFVSHETYTPARGGSASAEINALRAVFGGDADEIVIANTKGFTGHPMGVGIEDVVAVKALETGLVPPIPNFREVDPELGNLNLSQGGSYPVQYALRLAAGFGSQISMSLLRWTPMPDGARRSPARAGLRLPSDRPAGVAGLAGQCQRRGRPPSWKWCSGGCASCDPGLAGRASRSCGRSRSPAPPPAPRIVDVPLPARPRGPAPAGAPVARCRLPAGRQRLLRLPRFRPRPSAARSGGRPGRRGVVPAQAAPPAAPA